MGRAAMDANVVAQICLNFFCASKSGCSTVACASHCRWARIAHAQGTDSIAALAPSRLVFEHLKSSDRAGGLPPDSALFLTWLAAVHSCAAMYEARVIHLDLHADKVMWRMQEELELWLIDFDRCPRCDTATAAAVKVFCPAGLGWVFEEP